MFHVIQYSFVCNSQRVRTIQISIDKQLLLIWNDLQATLLREIKSKQLNSIHTYNVTI